MNSHHRRLARPLAVAVLSTALLAGAAAAAQAARPLGSTAVPAGASGNACGTGQVIAQVGSDPATPYTVPAGGGQLTQWQTNTSSDSAGATMTLVVLRPSGGADHGVVGTDTETLPTPLPAGAVATFPLSPPISVRAGDELGLYTNSDTGPTCWWGQGATPTADSLMAVSAGAAPATGQTLTPSRSDSGGGLTLDLAATLVSNDDVGVGAAAGPPNATAGNLAELTAMVTDGGPNSGPITFTDDVPAGLQIQSIVAGSGICSTAGQRVTCTITGLSAQQSAPVEIGVVPAAAGSYVNQVSVAPAPGVDDPVAGNNSASTTLSVVAVPGPPGGAAPQCVVPPLARTPLAIAERVLILLGCRLGHVTAVHTRSIPAGLVIRSGPVQGTYAGGRLVAIDVSAGPRHHARRSKRRTRKPAAKRKPAPKHNTAPARTASAISQRVSE